VGLAAYGGAVSVTIADNGAGIDAEAKDRLFEPFFTTKARGVGLGLSVSKRIVEAHGGQITVESEREHGAQFTIVLPVIAAPRVAADSAIDSTSNVPAT
jgi:two-component system sensor kinase FixL